MSALLTNIIKMLMIFYGAVEQKTFSYNLVYHRIKRFMSINDTIQYCPNELPVALRSYSRNVCQTFVRLRFTIA